MKTFSEIYSKIEIFKKFRPIWKISRKFSKN